MNKDGKQLSILVVGTSQEVVTRSTSELGIENYETDIRSTRASAIEALKGQTHYDVIITTYGDAVTDELELLLEVGSLDHRKSTPIVMLSEARVGSRPL
jgi:PleD family two-component response regulator